VCGQRRRRSAHAPACCRRCHTPPAARARDENSLLQQAAAQRRTWHTLLTPPVVGAVSTLPSKNRPSASSRSASGTVWWPVSGAAWGWVGRRGAGCEGGGGRCEQLQRPRLHACRASGQSAPPRRQWGGAAARVGPARRRARREQRRAARAARRRPAAHLDALRQALRGARDAGGQGARGPQAARAHRGLHPGARGGGARGGARGAGRVWRGVGRNGSGGSRIVRSHGAHSPKPAPAAPRHPHAPMARRRAPGGRQAGRGPPPTAPRPYLRAGRAADDSASLGLSYREAQTLGVQALCPPKAGAVLP
jgi:hypothetical protein